LKQTTFAQITTILQQDFSLEYMVQDILHELGNLYDGHWPEYEPCRTPYHNYDHALDVTLASLRMASGWNKQHPDQPLSKDGIYTLLIAALFHDSGYIKDRGDSIGFGGKYSFNHTSRSKEICSLFFRRNHFPDIVQTVVLQIIETTDFNDLPDLTVYQTEEHNIIARMVSSADLIAQMADIQYMEHLHDLYTEFQEAYTIHGKETLQSQGIQIFNTFEELLTSTTAFYQDIVLPRLDFLGRMDQYLITYFGEGRNPYLENIIANLSAQMQAGQVKWQRLGEILQELNLVSKATIDQALARQKKQIAKEEQPQPLTGTALQDRLFRWANHNPESSQLGDILMQMNAVNPTILRKGILSQLIPESLLNALSRKELIFLLHISMVVQNSKQDPWVFNQIMQMVNEALSCSSTALYLACSEQNELVCALFAGQNEPPRRVIGMDKGLSGWVYSHGRTAFLQKGMIIAHNNPKETTTLTEDVNSLLGIPLYINGVIIGVLELSGKTSGHFTPHDADIMTVVAHILAGLLQTVSHDYASSPSHY
jgi:putative methionine-R-sulfoxide reductase with GAF domain